MESDVDQNKLSKSNKISQSFQLSGSYWIVRIDIFERHGFMWWDQPIKGIERYQALYRFRTRRRASSLFTDRTGRTCCKVRLAASRPAAILGVLFQIHVSLVFCKQIQQNSDYSVHSIAWTIFQRNSAFYYLFCVFIHLNYIMLSSFCYLTWAILTHRTFSAKQCDIPNQYTHVVF